MSDTVIAAILTFLASVISAAFVSIGNRNKTIKAMEQPTQSSFVLDGVTYYTASAEL